MSGSVDLARVYSLQLLSPRAWLTQYLGLLQILESLETAQLQIIEGIHILFFFLFLHENLL